MKMKRDHVLPLSLCCRQAGISAPPQINPPNLTLLPRVVSSSLRSKKLLTAVKREKFAKNKKTTSKERLLLLLFKVCYFTSILLIY